MSPRRALGAQGGQVTHSRASGADRRRGSALILALAFTGLMFAVAISFQQSLRSQLRESREGADSLESELAAQSGVEYLRRQLTLDPAWETGDETESQVFLSNGATFRIVEMPGSYGAGAPTTGYYQVEGDSGDARVVLDVTVDVEPGDPLKDKALVVGEDVSLNNVVVDGDMLWTNASSCRWYFTRKNVSTHPAGDVHEMPSALQFKEAKKLGIKSTKHSVTNDYVFELDPDDFNKRLVGRKDDADLLAIDLNGDLVNDLDGSVIEPLPSLGLPMVPLTQYSTKEEAEEAGAAWLTAVIPNPFLLGAWVVAPDGPNSASTFSRFDLRGVIVECAPEGKLPQEQVLTGSAHHPGWSLEAYVDLTGCVEYHANETLLEGLDTDNTVVVVNDPGVDLEIRDCQLRGGLVMYAENHWDPSSGPRNNIELTGTNAIGGLSPCSDNVGLMAPAAHVEMKSPGSTVIRGVSYWYSGHKVSALDHHGALFVTRTFLDVKDSTFTYVETLAEPPPDGILFYGGTGLVDVTQVSETF